MYKDDLQAAYCRIENLEGQVMSLKNEGHHCSGCKCRGRSLWSIIKGMRCLCGNPLHRCSVERHGFFERWLKENDG